MTETAGGRKGPNQRNYRAPRGAGPVQRFQYYVSQTVLKNGAGTCPVPRIPAAQILAAVIQQLRSMPHAPEVVVSTWRAAQSDLEGASERMRFGRL